MNEELLRLRRRIRMLAVLLTGLAVVATYGWLRPAAQEVISVDSVEDVQQLRHRISEASHRERIRLLHEIGRVRGQQATSAIIELMRNARTTSERRLAIAQLGRIGSAEAVRELAELARTVTERRTLRLAAVAALGSCRNALAREQLLALLESADPAVGVLRMGAISALGESGGDRAAKWLAALCNEVDARQGERLAAIQALGRTGAQQALAALLSLTTGARPVLRKAAVAAIGSVGTDPAKQALIRIVQSGARELKASAVTALAQYDGDDVQVLLASASANADDAVAAAAIEALGPDHPLAQQALSSALASSKSAARRAAVRALGKSSSPEAAVTLAALLGDRSVGQDAAVQLASLATPEARQALLAAARVDAPVNAQYAALSALSQLQGKDVQRTLGMLVKDGRPAVAAQALAELARRQGPEAKQAVIAAYRDGNRAMRSTALAAMADLKDPATREILIQAARSNDYSESYRAISSLAKVAPDQAAALLSDLVKTGPRSAKNSAVQELGRLGGPAARGTLLAALKDKDSHVNVSWALGQLRDETTRRELRDVLDDPTLSSRARQQAVMAMQYSGDRQGLLAAAKHPDKQVSSEALRNLSKIGGSEAERTLLDALGSPEASKKQSAVSALSNIGTPKAIKALGQALHDKDTFYNALSGLMQIGGKQAMGEVTDLYQTQPKHRQHIVRYLNNSPGQHARRLLEAALNDENASVVATAAAGLARRGDPRLKGRMVALMQSSTSKNVRYAIARQISYDPSTYKQYKALVDEIIQQGS